MWHGELCDEHHRANIELDHVLKGVHQFGVVDAAECAGAGVVYLQKDRTQLKRVLSKLGIYAPYQNVQLAIVIDGAFHDASAILVLGDIGLNLQRLVFWCCWNILGQVC